MTILEVMGTLPSKQISETQRVFYKELDTEEKVLVNIPYRITITADDIIVPFAVDMDNYTNYTIAIEAFTSNMRFCSFRVMTRDDSDDFDFIEDSLIKAYDSFNSGTPQLLFDNSSRLNG